MGRATSGSEGELKCELLGVRRGSGDFSAAELRLLLLATEDSPSMDILELLRLNKPIFFIWSEVSQEPNKSGCEQLEQEIEFSVVSSRS